MPATKSETSHAEKNAQDVPNSSTSTISTYVVQRGERFFSNHVPRSTFEERPPLVCHWFNYLPTVNEYQILLLNLHKVHSPTVIWTLNPSPNC